MVAGLKYNWVINMIKLKTLYFTDRKAWRNWLENNFESEPEIWLIFPHKSSGKPRIPYNDAVEEALCFGWIDSIIKSHDSESAMQKFTPRNPKSGYSQPNKERLKWLTKENMIHPSMKNTIVNVLKEKFVFPTDIIKAIKKDKEAWKNDQKNLKSG
jgi:uncharacterized protein YdeI (YjbR/CyaY-like superfamily)